MAKPLAGSDGAAPTSSSDVEDTAPFPDLVPVQSRSRTTSMINRGSFIAWNKRSSISSNKPGISRKVSDASSMTRGLAVTNHLSIFDGLDADESSVRRGSGPQRPASPPADPLMAAPSMQTGHSGEPPKRKTTITDRILGTIIKYAKFIGPGAMISVAYQDPGNFAADSAAGASFEFNLLYIILLATVFAIFLQSLSIKLGSVTGLNLAQMIKLHTPWWLNIILYVFAEAATIATDMAEVIGTAIALNLLFKIPLVAGCVISILDVLIILLLYRLDGNIKGVRIFELFVLLLVFGVVICFCIQLSLLENTTAAEVLKGYLPSKTLLEAQAIYQSCGILGATVMPHSLYLGSGTCHPRMLQYDRRHNKVRQRTKLTSLGDLSTHSKSHRKHKSTSRSNPSTTSTFSTFSLPPILAPVKSPPAHYRPSLSAINHCLRVSIVELTISLATFALFVNSAILIVTGATLHDSSDPDQSSNASLFHIHDLLATHLAPSAGTLFAVSLLLSGTSAGIVCTIAGQMVSEAQLEWRVTPWVRRLITRSISIAPAVVIAAAVGKDGLSTALVASQVVLCFCLPAVIGPLVWFTSRAEYAEVKVGPNGERVVDTLPEEQGSEQGGQQVGAGSEEKDAQGQAVGVRVSVIEVPRPVGLGVVGEEIDLAEESRVRTEEEEEPRTASGGKVKEEVKIAPWMDDERSQVRTVQFRNHWATTAFAILIWVCIVCMNVTTVVYVAMGKSMGH
ncbi:Manganese transporter SMF1-like protein 1 [Elsinoe fawcettii]|nr:Manganese transporter SMF1-like protein 1 [Elsinoe fawcettii]